MTRIGIFGGSFNPVHMGHVLLARQLRQLAALDEVWLMVSPQNPLKQSAELLDDRLRYQLTRIALHGEQGIRACSYELHLPKPSYTWNTLQHLKEDFPECDFTLLIGGDNWALFPKWYRAGDILASHRVVVYPRRGVTIEADSLPSGVSVVEARLLDVSSTDVRSRVAGEHSIRGLVPATIESLVQSLYRGIAAGEER